MLELYEAFADYYDIMTLTEEMIAEAARASIGTTKVEWRATPSTSHRRSNAVRCSSSSRKHAGVDVHPSQPIVGAARDLATASTFRTRPTTGRESCILRDLREDH